MGRVRSVRELAWLASGVPVGAVLLVGTAALLTLGVAGLPVLVGLPILLGTGLLGVPVGTVERRRLRLAGVTVADPHAVPVRPGLPAWLRCRYREPATWRELAYVLASALFWPVDLLVLGCLPGVPLSLLGAPLLSAFGGGEVKVFKLVLLTGPGAAWAAVPVGLAGLVVALPLLVLYSRLRIVAARALLVPRGTDVPELVRSRARLVDAFDAERRRIERDLHDGTQQRLVALGMTLGLARMAGPDEIPVLVARAHDQAGQALTELRGLIQGIHPRILTDRGLPAALAELADRSPVPVDVRADLPARQPAPIEVCAYFVVSEALTNIARHSGARHASVVARLAGRHLVVEIRDDGTGGADPGGGSGLAGLTDRVAAAGGRLVLDSPAGGPTVVAVELPCG